MSLPVVEKKTSSPVRPKEATEMGDVAILKELFGALDRAVRAVTGRKVEAAGAVFEGDTSAMVETLMAGLGAVPSSKAVMKLAISEATRDYCRGVRGDNVEMVTMAVAMRLSKLTLELDDARWSAARLSNGRLGRQASERIKAFIGELTRLEQEIPVALNNQSMLM